MAAQLELAKRQKAEADAAAAAKKRAVEVKAEREKAEADVAAAAAVAAEAERADAEWLRQELAGEHHDTFVEEGAYGFFYEDDMQLPSAAAKLIDTFVAKLLDMPDGAYRSILALADKLAVKDKANKGMVSEEEFNSALVNADFNIASPDIDAVCNVVKKKLVMPDLSTAFFVDYVAFVAALEAGLNNRKDDVVRLRRTMSRQGTAMEAFSAASTPRTAVAQLSKDGIIKKGHMHQLDAHKTKGHDKFIIIKNGFLAVYKEKKYNKHKKLDHPQLFIDLVECKVQDHGKGIFTLTTEKGEFSFAAPTLEAGSPAEAVKWITAITTASHLGLKDAGINGIKLEKLAEQADKLATHGLGLYKVVHHWRAWSDHGSMKSKRVQHQLELLQKEADSHKEAIASLDEQKKSIQSQLREHAEQLGRQQARALQLKHQNVQVASLCATLHAQGTRPGELFLSHIADKKLAELVQMKQALAASQEDHNALLAELEALSADEPVQETTFSTPAAQEQESANTAAAGGQAGGDITRQVIERMTRELQDKQKQLKLAKEVAEYHAQTRDQVLFDMTSFLKMSSPASA